ncbi:hypothetical protein PISMIDRAFT_251984 [Pisolithus microcarpus 441]|uniref:Uncharacterized protein n=1 Tax=Pisolithus microcarpus 441 TaxID=765257 RepID=A0A0C9XWA9_9AGAM|nr:hypothetical protein PISMIDRAFT_251984 [Pisolithus microcarpus 441]
MWSPQPAPWRHPLQLTLSALFGSHVLSVCFIVSYLWIKIKTGRPPCTTCDERRMSSIHN